MARRRLHVYLFTDLVGSTDLKRRLGDAAGAEAIAAHDRHFRACLRRYGGTEQNSPGDGFFATFELPSSAIECALAFQAGLAGLDLATPVRARVGVHMGESLNVPAGTGQDAPDKLLGLAIDLSGRIMSLAEGGQILLTRHAYDSVRQQVTEAPDGAPIEWRAHGAYRFKGADEPMEVFEVGIPGLSPLRAPRGSAKVSRAGGAGAPEKRAPHHRQTRRDTRMYGRDADLAHLRELYALASAGDGQAVLVEGEAGIGKTRLIEEFLDTLDPAHVLAGAYEPGGASASSGAYSRALRDYLGGDVERALAAYMPETPRLVPAFAAHVNRDAPPEGATPLSRESLQTAFVQVARHLSRERPTVFWIDDLHFASELGRALFASLACAAPGERLLVLGTTRPDLPRDWTAQLARLDHFSRPVLERLESADVERIATEQHAADPARVAALAHGVPYFAVEILRARGDEAGLPSSVKELIRARTGALDPEDRELLQIASCHGFEFDPHLVADVAGLELRDVLRRLARIEEEHGLIRFGDESCMFDHHQVQEVTYARLPPPLRREYHAGLAEACEQHRRADAPLLAYHYLRGHRAGRARPHLEPALEQLARAYRHEAILDLADRALEVPALLDDRARAEVLLGKAAALDSLGRRDEQRGALEDAGVAADRTGDGTLRSRARRDLGSLLVTLSKHDAAREILRNARDLARAAGDRAQEARVLTVEGNLLQDLNRHAEAEERYEQALAICRGAKDREAEAPITGNLGGVLFNVGRFEEAGRHFERFRELGRELGDRKLEAHAAGSLGRVALAVGRTDDARALFEECVTVGREIGHRMLETTATGNLGTALRLLGRLDEARDCAERALVLSRTVGSRLLEAHMARALGNVLQALGRFEEARRTFEHARGVSREIGDRRGEAFVSANLGLVLLDLGHGGPAREACTLARAVGRDIGSRHAETVADLNLGEVLLFLGRPDEAHERFDAAHRLAREMGNRSNATSALRGLATVAEERGAPETAYRLYEQTLAHWREQNQSDAATLALTALARLDAARGDAARAAARLDEARALGRGSGSAGTILSAAVERARLPGGDAQRAVRALEESAGRVNLPTRMSARLRLWELTGDFTHLEEAHGLLACAIDHAPPDCRETMVENNRVHRAIASAWKEHGRSR